MAMARHSAGRSVCRSPGGENEKEGKGEKKRGARGRREALNNPAVATQSGTGIGMSS